MFTLSPPYRLRMFRMTHACALFACLCTCATVPALRVGKVMSVDLQPTLRNQEVHLTVAKIVAAFLLQIRHSPGSTPTALAYALAGAEDRAAKVEEAIVRALQLEGSTALGAEACNSDHPTNPQCQYPQWPAHSLPPGKPLR